MFNKFILSLVPESKKHLVISVIFNVLALLLNISIIALFVYALYAFTNNARFNIFLGSITLVTMFILRYILIRASGQQTYLATGKMKKKIRALILEKNIVNQKNRGRALSTAEITQLALEGVEQTEMYISVFIPQFFYALSSVIIVFTLIAFISLNTALVLLAAIPLIPLSVLAVVKFAKRLFSRYWGNYTNLGGDFLDYTSGMTTLKIHDADASVAKDIDDSAEKFRKITMRVLGMQLNSITVMDAIAFGGAAIAITFGLRDLLMGHINMYQMLFVALISADFFLPLRALGSAFHVAMNGITAARKIEMFLETSSDLVASSDELSVNTITFSNVTFNYNNEKPILTNFDMSIKRGQFIALVGDSGSGKTTIAALLNGYESVQDGVILLNDTPLDDVNFFALNNALRRVSFDSRILKGTIRSNLLLGNNNATEEELFNALQKANLYDFTLESGGLQYKVSEGGANLSGGERQRLALARMFLTKADLYIFDEALASIDKETEESIMTHIYGLTKDAAVLFITHRLEVIKDADMIYLLNEGQVERGTHNELIALGRKYHDMYLTQTKKMQGVRESEKS